jgi:hypothetical protein
MEKYLNAKVYYTSNTPPSNSNSCWIKNTRFGEIKLIVGGSLSLNEEINQLVLRRHILKSDSTYVFKASPRRPHAQNFKASSSPCQGIRKGEGKREKICKTGWEPAAVGAALAVVSDASRRHTCPFD